MKTLYLVRHAKSDQGNPLLKDIDRPLNQRGYRDAYFMSELMKKQKHIPEILITSSAVRAYSTALIFLKSFGIGTEKLLIKEGFYESGMEAYINELNVINDEFDSAMLFAHNPTITYVSNSLCDKKINDFPTCGIACLDLKITQWKEIQKGKGNLRFFEFPKKISRDEKNSSC